MDVQYTGGSLEGNPPSGNVPYSVEGDYVKKLNPFDLYQFGKHLAPIDSMNNGSKVAEKAFDVWFARYQLSEVSKAETTILPPASLRAVRALSDALGQVVPSDPSGFANIDKTETFGWRAQSVTHAYSSLETVLRNDVPSVAAYFVTQKGIYRTEDLIEHADNNFLPETKALLPEQAKADIREAGKCLAYEIPTACSFHLWRAVETVMGAYYKKLTTKTFEEAGVGRNWDQYIRHLNDAKADSKITQFLNHIRKEYRNPTAHPEEMIGLSEAFGLFGAAASSINQMVLEIKK